MKMNPILSLLSAFFLSWVVLVVTWFVLMLGAMATLRVPKGPSEIDGMVQMVNVGIGLAFVSYGVALSFARGLLYWSRRLSTRWIIVVFVASAAVLVLFMHGFTAFPMVHF